MSASPLAQLVTALPRLTSEARRGAESVRPIAVSGPPSVVAELKRLLTDEGDTALVGSVGILELDRPELANAAAIVYTIRGESTPADEHALRRADRQGLPLLCLVLSDRPPGRLLPYVLATDVVVVPTLEGAVEPLAKRLARRTPEQAWALAARLPALRGAVSEEIVRRAALHNGLAAAASRGRGTDVGPITQTQLRMILRLASAAGAPIEGPAPLPLLGAAGVGLAFRELARVARNRLPGPPWLVNAAVAFGGTLLLGRVAQRRLG
jgi:hypothetical protein